jgi:linoleate 10R-lipoxygenase
LFFDRFFLASNNDAESQRDQLEALRVLQTSPDQAEKIARYFYEKTRELIISKSFAVSDQGFKVVDIVRDVLRYVPLCWAATELVCESDIVYSDVADGRLNCGNRLA